MQPNNNFSGNYQHFNNVPNANGFQSYGQQSFGAMPPVMNQGMQMPQGAMAYNNYPLQGVQQYQQYNQQHVGIQGGLPLQGYPGYVHNNANMAGNASMRHPVAPVRQPPPDKHQRYKMEQQQKFRNLGQSYKKTSIDSMLNNIVSTSTKKPAPEKESDDFGDFLQAPMVYPSPSPSPNPSNLPAPVQHNSTSPSTPTPAVSSNNTSNLSVTHTEQTKPVKQPQAGVDLQSKMLASLDLNSTQQASRKFKPSLVDITSKTEGKTFQASMKAADWSNMNVEQNDFYVAPAPPAVVESSPSPATNKTKPVPLWITDATHSPTIYKQVFEACITPDGLLDTGRLYPILLKSQLSNEVLGSLWSMANKSVPGRLNQQEMNILLALIALTQKGHPVTSVESVFSFQEAPIPDFNVVPSKNNEKPQSFNASPQQTNYSQAPAQVDDDFDDFQDFQSVAGDFANIPNHSVNPTASNIKSDITPKILNPPAGIFPAAPLNHENANSQNTDWQDFSKSTDDKYFAFAAFSTPVVSSVTNENQATVTDFKLQSSETSQVSSFSDDKYSAFEGFSTKADDTFDKPSLDATSFNQENILFPKSNPPSYQTLFKTSPTALNVESQSPKNDPSNDDFGDFKSVLNAPVPANTSKRPHFDISAILEQPPQSNNSNLQSKETFPSTENVSSTRVPTTIELPKSLTRLGVSNQSMFASPKQTDSHPNDKYSAFKIDSPFKSDTLSIKSDTNSVKSLELTNLSHSILQASLGTAMAEKDPVANGDVLQPDTNYGLDVGNDFDDFAMPPEVPDSYDDDFDDFQDGHSTLAAFDAFEYNEENKKPPPKIVMPKSPQITKDEKLPEEDKSKSVKLSFDHSTKLKESEQELGISPPKELKITPNMSEMKDIISEPKPMTFDPVVTAPEEIPATFEPKVATEDESPVSELEKRIVQTLTGIDRASPANGLSEAANRDECVDQWEKCLSHCYNIIASSNEILSSIQSPNLCSEVINSASGHQFIADLSEVYGVACKVFKSAQDLDLQKETLKHLHKQIQLAWNNLIAFCPGLPANDVESSLSQENSDFCGVCLLKIHQDKLSYAGSHYHAPCANFWVNCVASILPALRVR